MMLFLWYMSLLVSIVTFVFGVINRSSLLMFISAVTFLPVALYFYGANIAHARTIFLIDRKKSESDWDKKLVISFCPNSFIVSYSIFYETAQSHYLNLPLKCCNE